MATAKKIQSDISSLKVAIRVAKNDAIKKKLKSRLEMAENELASIKSGGKPRKVSTSGGTKSLLERAKALVKKNKKFARYKGSGVDLEKDAKEGARETGRRVSKGIKGNQWASKEEAKGNVYYEYRVNRLDVKQPKKKQTYPKLEKGGYMADGGGVKYPTDLKVGSIIKGVGFPMLKGIDDGKYYKVVELDNYSATFVLTDSQGKKSGLKKIRHYLSSIDGGIRTASRGDNNGIEVVKYAHGGYMAKGGKTKKFSIDDVVYNKRTKTIGIVRMEDEKGETKTDADGNVNTSELQHYNPLKYSNQKDAKVAPSTSREIEERMLWQPFKQREMGGYMAKGGIVEHGLEVGDKIVYTDGNNIYVINQNEEFKVNLTNGKRVFEKFNPQKNGGMMAHGGETHRAEDPEVEIDEEEMKVVRGYSDDEAYEYAKGGMTLKAGDIVEATTGVKLKVMDFKPDFGGRALVQRIDEFGEGLKPAWMPLTKFKLPKLI